MGWLDFFGNRNRTVDLGFKVFKLSPSNFKVWEAQASNDAGGDAGQVV
jgi:hypothetical protein